jgi:hypothetical protein
LQSCKLQSHLGQRRDEPDRGSRCWVAMAALPGVRRDWTSWLLLLLTEPLLDNKARGKTNHTVSVCSSRRTCKQARAAAPCMSIGSRRYCYAYTALRPISIDISFPFSLPPVGKDRSISRSSALDVRARARNQAPTELQRARGVRK